MISLSAAILGLSNLSALTWGGNTFSQVQFTSSNAPWCAGLGESTIDTLANFRLYAWNTDRPNYNSTGIPLVLATTGVTAAAYSHTLATLESYGSHEPAEFSIEQGGIVADSEAWTVATSFNPGDSAFFYTSNQQPLRDPTGIFCVVPSNDVSGDHPYPYLAVHRSYDNFHLCPHQLRRDLTVWKVVYDISFTSYYDLMGCRPVLLNVVY